MNDLKFKEPIFVTRPLLPPIEEYYEKLKVIWSNKWVTNNGPIEIELQEKLREYLKVRNIELFSNGHSALDIAIKSLDLKGEVITTPFTFASTTQAIIANNLTPVFGDVSPDDYNLNPDNIENLITDKTEAIIPVHVFGNPCDVNKIEKIAKQNDLKVIYDAAHAFGVFHNGKSIANYGDISMFSFHATKVFNTVEGGALIFNDDSLDYKFKAYKNFGITRDYEEVRFLGQNAKMNELEAAMGLINLNYIDEAIKERKILFDRYVELFSNLEEEGRLKLVKPKKDYDYNYSYFTVKLNTADERDHIFNQLPKYNVFPKKYFYPPCNEFPAYDFVKNTPVAHDVSNTILSLPLYSGLDLDSVDTIVKIIELELNNF